MNKGYLDLQERKLVDEVRETSKISVVFYWLVDISLMFLFCAINFLGIPILIIDCSLVSLDIRDYHLEVTLGIPTGVFIASAVLPIVGSFCDRFLSRRFFNPLLMIVASIAFTAFPIIENYRMANALLTIANALVVIARPIHDSELGFYADETKRYRVNSWGILAGYIFGGALFVGAFTLLKLVAPWEYPDAYSLWSGPLDPSVIIQGSVRYFGIFCGFLNLALSIISLIHRAPQHPYPFSSIKHNIISSFELLRQCISYLKNINVLLVLISLSLSYAFINAFFLFFQLFIRVGASLGVNSFPYLLIVFVLGGCISTLVSPLIIPYLGPRIFLNLACSLQEFACLILLLACNNFHPTLDMIFSLLFMFILGIGVGMNWIGGRQYINEEFPIAVAGTINCIFAAVACLITAYVIMFIHMTGTLLFHQQDSSTMIAPISVGIFIIILLVSQVTILFAGDHHEFFVHGFRAPYPSKKKDKKDKKDDDDYSENTDDMYENGTIVEMESMSMSPSRTSSSMTNSSIRSTEMGTKKVKKMEGVNEEMNKTNAIEGKHVIEVQRFGEKPLMIIEESGSDDSDDDSIGSSSGSIYVGASSLSDYSGSSYSDDDSGSSSNDEVRSRENLVSSVHLQDFDVNANNGDGNPKHHDRVSKSGSVSVSNSVSNSNAYSSSYTGSSSSSSYDTNSVSFTNAKK